VPIPVYVRPPIYVIAPPRNIYFENIHNEIVFNNVTNVVIIKDRHGKTRKYEHWRDDRRRDDRAIAYAPSLPPSVDRKARELASDRQPTGRGQRQQRLDRVDLGPGREDARDRVRERKTEEFQSRDRLNRMRSEARRQRLRDRTANRGEDALQRDQSLDDNGQQQGRGERYKRKRNRDEARQQFLDEGGRQGESERYRRRRDRGEQQFQPRRRNRDFDMAEEQGFEQPGGRRSRGEQRRSERRDFRRSQEMGGEPQDDRRSRKRQRKSDEGCDRSEAGCGD
jgi:hypothetical protein